MTTNTRGGPIIWPLRGINKTDVQALQAALRPNRLLHPVFMRQRPRAFALLLAPDVPVNLPWNAAGSPRLIDLPVNFPRAAHQLLPMPATAHKIKGVTKDSTGTPLGSVTLTVLKTSDDSVVARGTSDSDGSYRVTASPSFDQRVDAYKAGSPDVAGTTVNTLRGQ